MIYVGLLAASTTAPVFGMQLFGLVLTWVGFAVAAVLVVLVTIRVARAQLPDPLRPMMCIYAAPLSMCLAAYLSCSAAPSFAFASVAYAASCDFYVIGLVNLARNLFSKFCPSFAAMTFPFVIAAAASFKYATLCLDLLGSADVAWLIATAQTVIACFAIACVLVRYIGFLVKQP